MKNKFCEMLFWRMIFILSCFLIVPSIIKSQNVTPFSLYTFDKYNENNAYGGLTGNRILSINVREQWVGLPEAPKYSSFSYSQPFYKWHGGIGGSFSSKKSGILNIFSFDFSYNYIYSSYYGIFSFALTSGLTNMRVDDKKIITPEGDYQMEIPNHNDQFLEYMINKDLFYYNFELSGLYNYKNLEIGIVFAEQLFLRDKQYLRYQDIIRMNWQYIYGINQQIYLKFFGLIYSDFIHLQTDTGIAADYKSIIAGINVRGYSPKTFDSISLIAGGNINSKLRIIYAYDISLSLLRKVEDGTHEIKLTYDLGKVKRQKKLPPVIFNPRL